MTNKSISQLTAGGAVASTDLFPDVQTAGVGPVKVTAAQIGDYVLSGSGLTNVLPVSRGGTGLSTLTAANYALYSTSASALTAGTLPVAAGGTGLTSLTTGYIPYGNGTGAFSSSAGLSYNGTQFFIGGTSSSYIYLTAGGTSYGLLYADNSRTQLEALQSLPLTLWTGGSERMRLDTSGNLGLGVTPSAWSSGGWIELNSTGVSSKGTLYSAGNTYYNGGWKYSTTAAASLYVQTAGANIWYNAPSGSAGSAISFTQAMTLNSAGALLVGTTSTPSTANARIVAMGSSGDGYVQFANTGGGGGLVGSSSGAGINFYTYTGAVGSETYSQRAMIDASGNLVLGVTPSAWNVGAPVFQTGTSNGSASIFANGANDFWMLSNSFFDGAAFKYIKASTATAYEQLSGQHIWYIAPSGSAGSTISFTQAMTLDASGNLGVGTTSPGARLHIDSSTSADQIRISNGAGATVFYRFGRNTSTGFMEFYGSQTGFTGYVFSGVDGESARIDSSGNLLVGTTTTRNRLTVAGSGTVATPTLGTASGTAFFCGNDPAYGLMFGQSGTGNPWIQAQRVDGSATAYDIVMQPSGGNLLVGTTSSVGRLVVQGSDSTSSNYAFRVYNSSSTGLMYVRNDGAYFGGLATLSPYNATTATGANAVFASDGFFYRSTSSRRYKKNIVDAVHGLAELLRLRSVTYNGINDGDQIFGGLIAEEVDAAGLTEFVLYDSDGRPDALHYGNMAGLFVKAIQELAAKVTALEAANG